MTKQASFCIKSIRFSVDSINFNKIFLTIETTIDVFCAAVLMLGFCVKYKIVPNAYYCVYEAAFVCASETERENGRVAFWDAG